MPGNLPPVICLMGATASGKTDLAIALREHFPLDLVSVDSAMVYRGMDIGTGKPDRNTLARAPHRLIDIREPSQPYSAAQFRDDAGRAVAEIQAQGRIPLLVGGTGLYFRALRGCLSDLPSADEGLRKRIRGRADVIGWPALHAELAQVDPTAAARIHPNDAQRVQRALEVYESSGRPMTAWLARAKPDDGRDRYLTVVLDHSDRERLHRRIERRLDAMFAAGFVDEVDRLRSRHDLNADCPSMRAVGYRQVWAFLEGAVAEVDMRARALFATRQYAKRQITWLRDEPGAKRFDVGSPNLMAEVIIHLHRTIK